MRSIECTDDKRCPEYYSKEEIDGEVNNPDCAFRVPDSFEGDNAWYCTKYHRNCKIEGEPEEISPIVFLKEIRRIIDDSDRVEAAYRIDELLRKHGI